MICNLDEVNDIIKEEGMELWVVSYGGCCSNSLVYHLEQNGYKCQTPIWHKILCHCPKYIDTDMPVIYIYDNPMRCFLSQKKRGDNYWGVNQKKLSNNEDIRLSDETLLSLMIHQFESWTKEKRDNVLIIKSCELFEEAIVEKLEKFLKKKINYFPISYRKPLINKETINEEIDETLYKLFEKYKEQINYINNYKY